jgi:hypothetical protein
VGSDGRPTSGVLFVLGVRGEKPLEYQLKYTNGQLYDNGSWINENSLRNEQDVRAARVPENQGNAEGQEQAQNPKKEESRKAGREVKKGFLGLPWPKKR